MGQSANKITRFTQFISYILDVYVSDCKNILCVCGGGCLCRAVTVLNTLYKDQQVAMTSQDCPWGPPTTSSCQSWVRRLQSGFNATSLKKKAHRYKSFYFTGRGFNNLSQVRMGRHIATGQLVAIKQTNLDDCTEEELLQLMVHCCT